MKLLGTQDGQDTEYLVDENDVDEALCMHIICICIYILIYIIIFFLHS